MKKVVNIIVMIINIFFVGSAFIFSLGLIPNISLSASAMLLEFAISVIISSITMIFQIKKTDNQAEKTKIRNYWLKTLFIIYIILLFIILFLNSGYRIRANVRGEMSISIENIKQGFKETGNLIPFANIIKFFNRMANNTINTSIVVVNLGVNLILFAPMGFFIPLLFGDKIKNMKQFVILILIITISVEITQGITSRGSTDIDDVILNTIGAVIIYLIMKTKLVKNLINKILAKEE